MEGLNADQRQGVEPNGKASYTIDQAAVQLTREGLSWSSLGQPAVVTYAYRASAPSRMPDDTGGFSQFTSTQIDATERALKLWSEVANVTFQRVGSGDFGASAYSNNATILFGDYATGEKGASAFAFLPGSRASGAEEGDVWVNGTLSENAYLDDNSYGFLTLVHEIGHTIGLSHPSDYDVLDGDKDVTYAANASYYEDSLEYSVMSYFEASDTGSTIESYLDAPGGPLIDDIAAAQRLYGANLSTNAGDTVYGNSLSNAGTLTSDSYLREAGGLVWGTIWDGGGVDTLDFSNYTGGEKIDLRPGSFSDVGAIGNLSIAAGTTIEDATGGAGDDTLVGNDAGNLLRGNTGDDVMTGGAGNDTYVGGGGTDRAVLGGNVGDYRIVDGGNNGLILEAVNGSDNIWIDSSTNIVQFQNGQYLSYHDVAAYVAPAAETAGVNVLLASLAGSVSLAGGSGLDRLYVDGVASRYTLARDTAGATLGDFVLKPVDFPGNQIHVAENIDQIEFQNGQYLALRDVPAYVAGNVALAVGGAQDDLMFQVRPSGYEFFDGGAGRDTVYLKGNAGDYVVTSYMGVAVDNQPSQGLELIARNGSGAELIANTTEIVQFQNGQYLALNDVPAYVAPAQMAASGVLHYQYDDGSPASFTVSGTSASDILLLNANAGDFTLSRDSTGDFVLSGASIMASVAETIDTVQFQNGQYLSLRDVPAYVHGSAVYTDATGTGDGNDLLFTAYSGDQYIIGAGGNDDAFLHGNVSDYQLRSVANVATPYNGDHHVTGYELVATNGSGNLYIDTSVETIHFQNGQYLAFADLPAYIHGIG